jgi:KDO2-lipid IV(A) lauroyltransferase
MKLLPKSARQRLEAIAVAGLIGLFRALPPDAASALGGAVARVVGPHLGVSRVARRNLARAFPAWDDAAISATLREVWDNLGRVAGEFPHIDWLVHNRIEVIGIEHLHAMRDDGACGLFISAHVANWELAGAVAGREGLPITLVYRAANNPWVEEVYREGRSASAKGGQIAKGSEGAREIMAVLKRGGHIGMLVDQKMNDGIAVPFFGRDAMTAPAIARFALKFRCPVVPARIERLGGAHFRLTFDTPLVLPDTGDSHADNLSLMVQMNDRIEEWIRQRPGQWLWLHKRWPD